MMKTRILAAPLLAALALVPAAGHAQPSERPAQSLPAVTVVPATMKELVEAVTLTGTLVARDEVLVGPEIEGLRVTELLAEEGQTVTRGQVLARLSREALEAQLAQNSAALERAAANIQQSRSRVTEEDAARTEAAASLNRARALMRNANTTEATLDQRVAAARSADARFAAAREGVRLAEAQHAEIQAQRRELMVRLGNTEIKAPAAGVISRRTARLGAVASGSAEPMFRIIAEGAVELEADVAETILAKLAIGQPASVLPTGHDSARPGKVRLVSPEVNRSSRLGRLRIAVDDSTGLTIGAFGRATVEVARRQGVAVPTSAVLFGAEGPRLQVVKDGQVETRPVAIGLKTGREVEIASGLAANESVVAISGTFLRAGDRVRPVASTE